MNRFQGRRLLLCLAALLLGVAPVGAAGEEVACQQALARGSGFLERGMLEDADRAFAEAARLAADGELPADYLEASLQGRIQALAGLYDFLGLRDVSRELLAVQMSLGHEEGAVFTSLDLGYLETLLGNLRSAEALLGSALGWGRAHAAFDSALAVRSHAQARLANVYGPLGRWSDALDALEEAADGFTELQDSFSLAETLNVKASIWAHLGDLDRVLSSLEEALSLLADEEAALAAEESSDEREYYLAELRSMRSALLIGTVEPLIEAGKPSLAARRAREALIQLIKQGDATFAAQAALALGRACTALESPRWARVVYDLAYQLAKDSALLRGRAKYALAPVLRALGDREGACRAWFEAARSASATGETEMLAGSLGELAGVFLDLGLETHAKLLLRHSLELIRRSTAGLSPLRGAEARGYEQRGRLHGLALRAGYASGDPEVVLSFVESTRAAAILAGLATTSHGAAGAEEPTLAEAREQLLATQFAYEAARESGRRKDVQQAAERYEAARVAWRDEVDRLQRRRPRDVLATDGRTSSLAEVQASLATGEAMAIYSFVEGRLRALVVTGADARVDDLGPAAEIRGQAERLRASARDPDATVEASTLAKRLVGGLSLPEDVRRILVSPDGPLAYLPWVLLAGDREAVLVPSASALALLRSREGGGGDRLLALGDVTYGRDRDDRVARFRGFAGKMTPLQHSRAEIEAIAREEDLVLLAGDATEDRLRAALGEAERWGAVHLSCHGVVDPTRPAWSALALGIGREDGFLTVAELFGMRLPADLVTLSACETGLGKTVPGEGLLGLPGAFLHAGADRVLASVWKVDDEATGALMAAFYGRRRAGVPAARALREAQASIRARERWAHPYYWAGWVLWGLPD